MRKFFKDFKAFISKGNILDMAIGFIMGAAFSAIVTAFTNGIIMPLVNLALAAIVGGDDLSSTFTFLKKAYTVDADGNTIIDLAKSIYIDWGAFITAIINFLIIALTLFLILKLIMRAKGIGEKARKEKPTKEEKKELKEKGVNLKDKEATKKALAELRESKKVVAPAKPTTEELLQAILNEIKAK